MVKTTSCQVLTMEKSETETSGLTFKRTGGWFMKKSTLCVIFLVFLLLLVAVGLLVYYYAPRHDGQEVQAHSGEQKTNEKQVKKEKVMDVRLPRHLVPLAYDVKLRPLFDEEYNIEGEVTIEMACEQTAQNITVHTKNIKVVNPPKVTDEAGQELQVEETKEDKDRDFYIVKLKDSVEKGTKYKIHIQFTAVLNDKLAGFYRSTYKTEEGEEKVLATTQFQVTDARQAFPCFDEPGFKAKFKISLGRKNNMNSKSNTEIEQTEPNKDHPGWEWDHYKETVNMSTYLLAFMVSEFEQHKIPFQADWKCSIYARPQAIRNKETEYAGSITPHILKSFENFYDIPYPLAKIDMAAVPDFQFGAMENWGLNIFRETALLFDPNVSSATNKKRIAIVVSHELAHAWFGNLVTPVWWTDLWLNEGFATYMQYIGIDKVHHGWRIEEALQSDKMHRALKLDSLESSHKISIPVYHPDQITEIFDTISYNKGASVIRMMAHFLTEDTFRKGVTRYLRHFSYKNAEQDDLWRFLTQAAHEDQNLPNDVTVKDIMDTWTLQTGYPVVQVDRMEDGKSIKLTQERFLLSNEQEKLDDSEDYTWWVPITYTSSRERNFTKLNAKPSQWIAKNQDTIMIDNVAPNKKDWIIVNIQQAGYYRVNYDEDNWKLITDQLNEDFTQIPPMQRTQLLDDAFNLARGGRLPYSTALSLLEYLKDETTYYPIRTALAMLDHIDRMFDRSPSYKEHKAFMRSLVDPLYERLDIPAMKNIDTSYPTLTDIFRNTTIIAQACHYANPDCIRNMKKMFKEFKENYDERNPDNPETQIPPDLKSVVYCNGIKHGDEDDWDFLWRHYELTAVATEKIKVISGLSCSRKLWILNSYLEKILNEDSGIRLQDGVTVFDEVASNPMGRLLAWNFFRGNFPEIRKRYGEGFSRYSSMITSVTKSFNTNFQLNEVLDFHDTYKEELTSAKRATEQAIETITNNVKWMEDNHNSIADWLKETNKKVQ